MVTNLLLGLGLTRDSGVLFWGRILSLCGLLASHAFDIGAQLAALGFPIGTVGVHRIEVAAIIVLWLASVNSTSPLPGAAPVQDPNRFNRVGMWLLLVLVGGLTMAACGNTVRHIAVSADNGFAQAVFTADDEWARQCKLDPAIKAPTPIWCVEADLTLKDALKDVGIVTLALQNTPKDALTLPKGLPDLVGDLVKVQGVVAPFTAADGQAGDFAAKVNAALTKALLLLNSFAGK